MPLGDTAEKTALAYEKVITGVMEDLVDEIYFAVPNLTKDEIIQLVDTMDLEYLVLDELGLRGEIDAVINQYTSVLGEVDFFAGISEESIQGLINLEKQTIIAKANSISNIARSEIAKGVLLGKNRNDMIKDLIETTGIKPYQAGVELNNQMNNFSSQVTRLQAENAPANQTYIYVGPADSKTRPICLQMLQEGEVTLDYIESTYGNAFVERGGYNCRHFWRPYSQELSSIKKKQQKQLKTIDEK
tara:strand:- start:4834 stop:5568 length:735 start_codon:yes stop_codon:yes gene_type:complete